MSDHTQSPWIVKHRHGNATISSDDGHGAFATVRMRPSKTNNLTELKANIALIAAAPELLEALCILLADVAANTEFDVSGAEFDYVRAAIAKAEGNAVP